MAEPDASDVAQRWCWSLATGDGRAADATATPAATGDESTGDTWTLRHAVDGRVLMPNFGRAVAGQGVNATVDVAGMPSAWRVCGAGDGRAAPDGAADVPAPAVWNEAPFTAGAGGAGLARARPEDEFTLRVAKARAFCIGLRAADGESVCCRSVGDSGDESPSEHRWRVVDGDRLQHVVTGKYLVSTPRYIRVTNDSHVWADNHTDLIVAEAGDPRFPDPRAWRWVLGGAGDETHHDGGEVLRHYGDGRCVDVHGWQFKNGGNMGVENSAHGACDGVAYVMVRATGAATLI